MAGVFGKNNKQLPTMKIVSVGKTQSSKAVYLVSISVLLKIVTEWKTNRNFYKLGIRTTAKIQKVAFLFIKTLNTLENTVCIRLCFQTLKRLNIPNQGLRSRNTLDRLRGLYFRFFS